MTYLRKRIEETSRIKLSQVPESGGIAVVENSETGTT